MDEEKNHIEMGDFSEKSKTVKNAQKRTKIPENSFFGKDLRPIKKSVNKSIANWHTPANRSSSGTSTRYIRELHSLAFTTHNSREAYCTLSIIPQTKDEEDACSPSW